MSIGIAVMLLIFTIIAATVISNISSNLIKNISEMDVGKEEQYRRIVIMSLKNAIKDANYTGLGIMDHATVNFVYAVSEGLAKNKSGGLVIDYPASATLISTDTEIGKATTLYFFEVYTEPSLSTTGNATESYGIILQIATTTTP